MLLIKKGTKIYSVFMNRCPRCNQGRFWRYNNPYKNILTKAINENLSCSVCSLKYEIEVGFWYGAMYISYAIGVAIMVFAWLASNFLVPEIDIFFQIILISCFLIILSPVSYHFSRLIWINIFVDYKK